MYLRELLTSLRRRWYLLIVAVVITAGVCAGMSRLIGPTYTAQGAVVLIPPSDPANPDANPFLSLGSLKQAGDLMIRSLSSDATHREVFAEAPGGGDYSVGPDYTTSAPVFIIEAKASSPTQVTAILKVVLAQVPTSLAALQQGLSIDAKNQIISDVIDVDEKPTFVIKAQLRAVVGAGAAVFGLLCMLIGAVDAVARRRQATQSGIRAVHSGPQPADPEDPTPIELGGQVSKRRQVRLNR